ncbi:hypothetical protein B0H14DRAFT_3143490 [Mycena olivaceomarginata]|nr:hypothetical protein B0H14DRAFT_3143490 [Mycena olivaceomarginata]
MHKFVNDGWVDMLELWDFLNEQKAVKPMLLTCSPAKHGPMHPVDDIEFLDNVAGHVIIRFRKHDNDWLSVPELCDFVRQHGDPHEAGRVEIKLRTQTLQEHGHEVVEIISSDSEPEDGSDIEVVDVLTRAASRSSSIYAPESENGNASDSGDEADSDHDDKLEDSSDHTAKLRDSDTIWRDPDIKSRVLTGKFRITKILTVDCIEYLNNLPSIWPVSQIPTAYVVDLDTRHGDIDPESGWPNTLDFLIRNHDNDLWQSSSGKGDGEPMVVFEPGKPAIACRQARMTCKGSHACERIDPALIRVERYDLNPTSRDAIFVARQETRRTDGATAENRTIGFFDLVSKKQCATPTDRGHYWVACDGWTKQFKENHHTFSVPDFVDEGLLLKLFAGDPMANDDSKDTPPCTCIVHPRTGLKQTYCPDAIRGAELSVRSEIRCKKARVLICELADPEYRHLVFMQSMVIRWNTMYAEMRRARNLSAGRPKPHHLQQRRNGRCTPLTGSSLMDALEVRIGSSSNNILTLANTNLRSPKLPEHLVQAPRGRDILHPAIRLMFFETEDWDLEVVQRARELLTETVRKGFFAMTVKGSAETKKKASSFAGKDEVDIYIGRISPVKEGFDDPLGWWKQNQRTLLSISRVTQDILAISGALVEGHAKTRSRIIRYPCNASHTIWVPLDPSIRKALVFHKPDKPHTHPMPPLTKMSVDLKHTYTGCIEDAGTLGATVNKADNARTTKLRLGKPPSLFSPAYGNRRHKKDIIFKVKAKKYPAGFGVAAPTRSARPPEDRYIHCCCTTPDGGIIIITGVLFLIKLLDDPGVTSFDDDTMFKRIAGEMNEWELSLFFKAVLSAATVIRAYVNWATTDYYEILFDELQRIKLQITKKVLRFKRFVPGGNLLAMNVDMEAAQVLGAARSILKTNQPEYSGIPRDTSPAEAATYFVKLCYRHSKYSIKTFALKRLQSRMHPEDWDSTPSTTNTGETQHHWTNSLTGTNLSLVEAIERPDAREVDETVAQEIEASMRKGILANEQNEAHHRLSRNLQRQAKAAQKVRKTNEVTVASKEINADIADLQEARRQSSAKEKALREELRAMKGATTAPQATATRARRHRNDESAVFSASSTGRVKPTATTSEPSPPPVQSQDSDASEVLDVGPPSSTGTSQHTELDFLMQTFGPPGDIQVGSSAVRLESEETAQWTAFDLNLQEFLNTFDMNTVPDGFVDVPLMSHVPKADSSPDVSGLDYGLNTWGPCTLD